MAQSEEDEVKIVHAISEKHIAHARELFQEYFDWLSQTHGMDIGYQGTEAELASLPGAYKPDQGRLLLAYDGESPVACGGLRPLAKDICELKRMYVRPAYRGKGLGRQMAIALIDEARAIGYRLVRVDTAAFMYAAQALYRSLGFQEIEPYYDAPPELAKMIVFMEMKLAEE